MGSLTKIKTMGPVEWGLLFLLSALWGASFFFGKVALAEFRPFTLVLGRVSIAALVLILMVRAMGQRIPASPKLWASFLVMGFLNNLIPFSLLFWGQTQIPSGLASILNATTPLWTILMAHFLTADERLTPNRLSGVAFGLLGAIVVIGPKVLMNPGLNALAQLAVVGAAISYALAGIYGKRFQRIPPMITAAGQLTCTTVMMTPVALVVDRPWLLPAPTLRTLAALLGLSLLSTAVAYVIYFRLLSTAGATNLLLVTFLIPVSALFLGMTFLGERLDLRQYMGMGLIGLGLLTIDGRLSKALRRCVFAGTMPQSPSTDEAPV